MVPRVVQHRLIIEKYFFGVIVKHLVTQFSEKHNQPTINIDVKTKELQFVWVNKFICNNFFLIAKHFLVPPKK